MYVCTCEYMVADVYVSIWSCTHTFISVCVQAGILQVLVREHGKNVSSERRAPGFGQWARGLLHSGQFIPVQVGQQEGRGTGSRAQ